MEIFTVEVENMEGGIKITANLIRSLLYEFFKKEMPYQHDWNICIKGYKYTDDLHKCEMYNKQYNK